MARTGRRGYCGDNRVRRGVHCGRGARQCDGRAVSPGEVERNRPADSEELCGVVTMPFVYELTLAEEIPQPEYTLVQQLVPAGTLVGTGQNVAVLSNGAAEFHLRAPLQGLLVE